jgi:large-conductance mechanosensitive channel
LKKKIAKEQAEPLEEKTPAAPTKDQELLAEIRDLLKK